MMLHKGQLEAQLKEEKLLIQSGVLREENPLDLSEAFHDFMLACRRGDLGKCQEMISAGVDINGKDEFDYTPLIIASLCGHFDLVRLLLESGALAERNSFQGERCIYNALNDRIRNLLLEYDYSKSTDPLQPWSSHITSLLTRRTPRTSDISLETASEAFQLHKFILAARTPYFRRKLSDAADTSTWRLPPAIAADAFRLVLQFLYLGDMPSEISGGRSAVTEEEILTSADKISKQLEVNTLWEVLLTTDRRLARQRYQDEVERAQSQFDSFFQRSVLAHRMDVETDRLSEIKWRRDNSLFADCLLRADVPGRQGEDGEQDGNTEVENISEEVSPAISRGIPIGPFSDGDKKQKKRQSVVYPVHKAMLLRSPYFETMFSSAFKEAQEEEYLHVVAIDCLPEVLEIVLAFLYTEKINCPLDLGLDLLYTADMLMLDRLKTKAAQIISTLGSGNSNALVDRTHGGAPGEPGQDQEEAINIYDIIHAAWDLGVQRLEEFAARYLANRLEDYIDEPEFKQLIRESAERLKLREETDTIELLDDIRYYLSERFRLRFEDAGLEEIMDEEGEIDAAAASSLLASNGSEGRDAGSNHNGPVTSDPTESQPTAPPPVNVEAAGLKTLGGDVAEDEFASDAINYQVLLGKIDTILDKLNLDA